MSVLFHLLAASASRFQKGIKSAPPRKYDVFLSFRGSDTRTGFADFLYKSLSAAGVSVYRDKEALPFGEQIEKELHQAIRSCKIAIPIISPQFVESRSCNQELSEIMNCRREHGKSVFPIFYKVNYVDVGCQAGKFGEDLFKHVKRYGLEEVQKWREALTSVAGIRGYTSQSFADGHEAELVEMVVAKVLSELKTIWIKQLPTFIGSVCRYILEKERRDTKWQVFMAFYGENIQSSLASYLEVSLADAGIKVFNSDDPSLIGKEIAHEIRNAIGQCKICIPIFSEKFHSSYFCLEDLAQMVECKKTNGQKVLPVFYKVKPCQLRHISLLQCKDLHISLLQRKDLQGSSTYERWERAVKELGSYRGWVSENIGNEGLLVKGVVQEVCNMLNNP